MPLKYFNQSDFDSCSPSCDISDVDGNLLSMLDSARELAGIPFKINSAYRSYTHELNQGRDGKSSHVKGLAVDISATDSVSRFKILSALVKSGFNRIGIHDVFIHVDIDKDKSENVLWLY